MVLGMCPTLAITNSVRNAIAMGLATTFVMASANGFISMVRKFVPKQVRIATYISMIATSVTIVDYLVKAISIPVYKALGPFIPLIVSNCLTLERAESLRRKEPDRKEYPRRARHGDGLHLRAYLPGNRSRSTRRGDVFGIPSVWTEL